MLMTTEAIFSQYSYLLDLAACCILHVNGNCKKRCMSIPLK
jgi:hypothetical protein